MAPISVDAPNGINGTSAKRPIRIAGCSGGEKIPSVVGIMKD
jgi:hypothetical protein